MTNPINFRLDNEDGSLIFSREFALLDPYNGKDAKRGDYELMQTFWVQWVESGNTYRVRAPQGLITDVASIPRIVWTFGGLTPDGLYRNAAVIHDVLYMWQGKMPSGWFQQLNGQLQWVDAGGQWSKDDCDRMFLRIMKACGVDRDTRTKMYWSVKLCGWPAWWQTDKTREKYRNAFISS